MTESSNAHPETGMTALFVRRPVLAFVVNALIIVAGLAAFFGVEVRELPDVDRPVIIDHRRLPRRRRRNHRPRDDRRARGRGVARLRASSRSRRVRPTAAAASPSSSPTASTSTTPPPTSATRSAASPTSCPRTPTRRASSRPTPMPRRCMRLAVTSDTMSVEDMTILVEDQIVDTAGRRAGRRRRAGLRRPREDLPHRRRPGEAREPRADRRRHPQRAVDHRLRQPGRLARRHQPEHHRPRHRRGDDARAVREH